MPTDGFTHYVTIGARRETDGSKSAWARYTFPAQLAAAPVPQPLWIATRLLRQNTSELPDLVEVTWRASTAVTLIADLPPRGYSGTVMTPVNVRLGAAGPDEGRVEGIGPLLKPYYNFPCDVYLGVLGIANGQESPLSGAKPPWPSSPPMASRPRPPPSPPPTPWPGPLPSSPWPPPPVLPPATPGRPPSSPASRQSGHSPPTPPASSTRPGLNRRGVRASMQRERHPDPR